MQFLVQSRNNFYQDIYYTYESQYFILFYYTKLNNNTKLLNGKTKTNEEIWYQKIDNLLMQK